jgi:hypothetical protein
VCEIAQLALPRVDPGAVPATLAATRTALLVRHQPLHLLFDELTRGDDIFMQQ